MYTDAIGVVSYEPKINEQLPQIIKLLNEKPDTRQAILMINRIPDHNSCCINFQFQIVEHILQKGIIQNQFYVIVNFRSQKECYRERDAKLICYITNQVLRGLTKRINKVQIDVNVGNYHV
jgi:hypothetical protein